MIKSSLAVATIGALVLFGYFYTANRSELSRTDKAKQAAKDVGDAVRDKGVAGLVGVRLKTKFGLDATRFLHTHYDEGYVVVYGMVPAGVDQQSLIEEAARVPGVSSVDLLVHARPEHIVPLKPIVGEDGGESLPEPLSEPASP